MKVKFLITAFAGVIFVAVLAGSVGFADETVIPNALRKSVNRIIVWKVLVPPEDNALVRRCPVCGTALVGSMVLPAGEKVMARHLRRGLSPIKECTFFFPTAETEEQENGKEKENEKKVDFEKMLEAAKQQGADGLLLPVLMRYSELVGKSYAASSPASVAFHLHLIRIEDSKEVWGFNYNETQRPLSENLIEAKKFWKRRARWVKAEQLIIEGIEKAVKSFPKCEAAAQ